MGSRFIWLIICFLASATVFSQSGFGAAQAERKDSDTLTETDTAVTVMSGIFTVGPEQRIVEKGKITVTDADSGALIGIYRPNKRNGKYLFILPTGRTYQVKFEDESGVFKTEDLIVPASTNFYRINQKINLGVL